MIRIPYAKQSITDDDIDAVVAALKSERLTQGPLAAEFEQAVAACCGASYAVAVSNGSMALIAACLALEVGPGDVVWTTPNTFIATANAAIHCGADIEFVDVDPGTGNLSVDALSLKLQAAEREGRLPKVVIPVHFAGLPCELADIAELAKRYDFHVIEDAAHALGSRYQHDPIGACRYSDLTIFSFHPVKSITTGEGGMVLTNDPKLHQRLQDIAQQGVVRAPGRLQRPDEGPWYYEQQRLGYNLRLTEMQAALGLSQLKRLPVLVKQRQELASRYHELLQDLPVSLPICPAGLDSAWHLYVIHLDVVHGKKSRKQIMLALAERGIGTQVHYIPVHTQPFYQERGFSWGDYPNAESFYQTALSLPLYPGLGRDEQDQVVEALTACL